MKLRWLSEGKFNYRVPESSAPKGKWYYDIGHTPGEAQLWFFEDDGELVVQNIHIEASRENPNIHQRDPLSRKVPYWGRYDKVKKILTIQRVGNERVPGWVINKLTQVFNPIDIYFY